jgi:pimeloyl-ACP methyl ester carboxylesterase
VSSNLTLSREAGSNLIVFVHGMGCVKESFEGAWTTPALQEYSLLAVDFPGHGNAPLGGHPCTMEALAEYLKDHICAMSYERLHIVAHSMGAGPALVLSRDKSLPIVSFINVEGNLIGADCSMFSRSAAAMDAASFDRAELDQLLSVHDGSTDPGVPTWFEWMAKADPKALHAVSTSLVPWSDRGVFLEWSKAMAGYLYVYGSASADMPVVAELGDIPTRVLEGSAHFPMLDNSEAFFALIAEHVSSV